MVKRCGHIFWENRGGKNGVFMRGGCGQGIEITFEFHGGVLSG
jgi:hypothetical protein